MTGDPFIERLGHMLHEVPIGIALVRRASGQLRHANPVLCALLGYSTDELAAFPVGN